MSPDESIQTDRKVPAAKFRGQVSRNSHCPLRELEVTVTSRIRCLVEHESGRIPIHPGEGASLLRCSAWRGACLSSWSLTARQSKLPWNNEQTGFKFTECFEIGPW